MKRALAVAATLLLLTACGGPDNKDPRQGRVVIDSSNCAFGDCYTNWKVCIGPNLLVHIDNTDDPANGETLFKGSPECEASQ